MKKNKVSVEDLFELLREGLDDGCGEELMELFDDPEYITEEELKLYQAGVKDALAMLSCWFEDNNITYFYEINEDLD